MPVVVIPTCFIDPNSDAPGYVERQMTALTVPTFLRELQEYYPQLFTWFTRGGRVPSSSWFGLFRESDGEELWGMPGSVLDEDDRLELVNLVGC